jgi:hypothetical protein
MNAAHRDDRRWQVATTEQKETIMTNPPTPLTNPPHGDVVARGRRARGMLLAGALTVGALAIPAVALASQSAAADAPAVTADEIGPRLERACLRVPNLQIRTDNLLARIGGDVGTRGSLLWLRERIDRAEEANRDQLVTVLENRLAVRTATVDVLEQRQALLVDLADRCRELGVDL